MVKLNRVMGLVVLLVGLAALASAAEEEVVADDKVDKDIVKVPATSSEYKNTFKFLI
jgi:hypothetical protein